ncbi:MAG: SRPBCC family protein [Polaromonas sp.]|nr:SRPBCC family protein [Polaromonas sp.]
MQFRNTFNVSLPPDDAWPFLLDIERIVPCMPGAELIEVIDEKNFKGKVSVRLGPVALTFICLAVFEEIDTVGRSARVKTQGSDAKGRGSANATIQFHVQPSGAGSQVVVDTDLSLTGAVAQYGRGAGMIQSVANQIISQFAKNLETQIDQFKVALTSSVPIAATANVNDAPALQTEQQSTARLPLMESAKPISGFALIFTSLWASVRSWFGAGPKSPQ